MPVSPLAGKPAPRDLLVNIPRLVTLYYTNRPDVSDPAQQVAFGTSGHRGSPSKASFNEHHILAIAQAISELRKNKGIDGPLFMGKDTHALSEPALATALEVFAANGVTVMIQEGDGYTPTPVISHAILTYNRGKTSGRADGVVITPSHNPPDDGGFKYNPPHGGPADTETTKAIEDRANEILRGGAKDVRRIPFQQALSADTTRRHDYVGPYVQDLENILDMEAIAGSGLKIGVDPLGGAGVGFWEPIADRFGLHIEVVNPVVDPTFGFMTVDKDGKIRMDCSSPYAMAGLIGLKDKFDIAFGNDPDTDRHGIVTRGAGLLAPNHYLAVAVWYLFQNRPGWKAEACVGKDPGLELDDRSGGSAPGEAALRGARGVQVVRGRAPRRILRFRRRGERRGGLPAEGRIGLVHGQGRNHHEPPGRRDHGPNGTFPGRTLQGIGRKIRKPCLRTDRHGGLVRGEGGPEEALARDGNGKGTGRRRDPRQARRTRRATTRRSAGSRWLRKTPGLRPGRPARKT